MVAYVENLSVRMNGEIDYVAKEFGICAENKFVLQILLSQWIALMEEFCKKN